VSNLKVDILSWLPWYKNAMPPNNDVTMLPEKRFTKKVLIETTLFEDKQFLGEGAPPFLCKTTQVMLQSNIDECIQACRRKDSLVEKLEKERPHLFSNDNGLLAASPPPRPKLSYRNRFLASAL